MTISRREKIKPLLEETLTQCATSERRDNDPVGLVWAYESPADREVAALFAGCLAYGRVDLVRRAIRQALEPLGPEPARFLREVSAHELDTLWKKFVYRMTRGEDLADLARAIQITLFEEESLQGLYSRDLASDQVVDDRLEHIEFAGDFVRTLRSRRRRTELHRGFRYLLPDPADGSACKRLHLFFRWMARGPDDIDLGLWQTLNPAALIMPLDTHTSRICRYLGLTERKAADGKAALEITRSLAECDPVDPMRYDFALSHLGISGRCIHRKSPDHCPNCPIEAACVLPQ